MFITREGDVSILRARDMRDDGDFAPMAFAMKVVFAPGVVDTRGKPRGAVVAVRTSLPQQQKDVKQPAAVKRIRDVFETLDVEAIEANELQAKFYGWADGARGGLSKSTARSDWRRFMEQVSAAELSWIRLEGETFKRGDVDFEPYED